MRQLPLLKFKQPRKLNQNDRKKGQLYNLMLVADFFIWREYLTCRVLLSFQLSFIPLWLVRVFPTYYWNADHVSNLKVNCYHKENITSHVLSFNSTVILNTVFNTFLMLNVQYYLWDSHCLLQIFSQELKELEAALKAAYTNKERAAQLAEKEATKHDTTVSIQCIVLVVMELHTWLYRRLCVKTSILFSKTDFIAGVYW